MSAAPPGPDPAERKLLLAVFLAGATLLGVAGSLDPDDRGYGTHTQLGMAPCGYLLRTGEPCPTCGMTTSFALFARFRVASAFRVQPFGAVLAALAWTATVGALFALVAGRSVRPWIARLPRLRWWLLAALVSLLASWSWTRARHRTADPVTGSVERRAGMRADRSRLDVPTRSNGELETPAAPSGQSSSVSRMRE